MSESGPEAVVRYLRLRFGLRVSVSTNRRRSLMLDGYRMSESGPEAVAERDHVGPSLMLDGHRMSESGPEAVAVRS